MAQNQLIEKLKHEGVFIIHALKGYEQHEKRIEKIFPENGLAFEYVTDGDPTIATKQVYEKFFIPTIESKLSQGVLSCTLNHIYAYQKIVDRKLKYALVFENDPFFLGDFSKNLARLFPEIENLHPGFIISIENTTLRFPSYWSTPKGQHLYAAKTGRAAGAYIIDLAAATNILADLNQHKCPTVIDWWHNSLIERGVFKMYWAHPCLVEQGSHNGQLSSIISTQNSSSFRKLRWTAQKLYKSYVRRLFKERSIL